jgi:alanyl-tRNA synthetase
LVAPDRLRFDFTSLDAVAADDLRRVVEIVNHQILADTPVGTEVKPYAQAVADGAMALFGEKYGDTVRVVGIGDFSRELCGGTHVGRIGEIGPVLVVSEGSVAAGVRRIEAITGAAAIERMLQQQRLLDDAGRAVRGAWSDVPMAIEAIQERVRGLEREVERLRGEVAGSRAGGLLETAVEIGGVTVLAVRVETDGKDGLRQLGDRLRDRVGSGVVVLGTILDGKPSLLAMVTPDVVAKGVKAGDIVREAATIVEGRGGGRPDRAEAGGKNPARLDDALAAVPAIVGRSAERG